MRSRPRALAHGADLAHEQLDRPGLGGLLDPRSPAADLVVEDDAAAGLGERPERLEVVVQRPGPAVQADERQLAGLFSVADHPVPGLAAGVGDAALGHARESTVHAKPAQADRA